MELGLPLVTATYWLVAVEAFGNRPVEQQPNVCHACEAETLMLLALRPDLVDQGEMMRVHAPAEGFGHPPGFHQWHPISHWSQSGVIGVPSAATAEKGHRLLEAAANALAERLLDGTLWPSSTAAPARRIG